MKILAFASTIALLSASCVDGSVTVDTVCSNEQLSTVSSLAAGKTGTVQYLTKPNFGDAISKLDNFGEVDLTLKNITVSTTEKIDLSFVRAASVSFVRDDDSEVLLMEKDDISGSTVVFQFSNVPSEVTAAVKNGTLKLRTRASGTMPYGSVTPTISICASGHVDAHASLSDIE